MEIEALIGIAVPSQDVARAIQNEGMDTHAARHRSRQDARTGHLNEKIIHISRRYRAKSRTPQRHLRRLGKIVAMIIADPRQRRIERIIDVPDEEQDVG